MSDESSTEFVYVVPTETAGPFENGELLVCAELPGTGVREIGYPSRKPLKWDCAYETFSELKEATAFIEATRTNPRDWVPVNDELPITEIEDPPRSVLPDASLDGYDSWHQKPCPSCGENGGLLETHDHRFGVRECDDCGSIFDITEK
jgi:hypothetical protein